jgi:hypothetical protein
VRNAEGVLVGLKQATGEVVEWEKRMVEMQAALISSRDALDKLASRDSLSGLLNRGSHSG